MAALGAGVIGGALGGGIAVTVLAPLTAANNFLGSYFFGSGMILGERQMYQDDWIKIKKRLDAGESFLVILEEVMKPNTQAVMQMARETVIAVSEEWNKIVLDYVQTIPDVIWNALKTLSGGESQNLWPLGFGVAGIINGKKTCATGFHLVGDECVRDSTQGETLQVPAPEIRAPKPVQQIIQQEKEVLSEISKVTQDKLMREYTSFLAKLSSINQQLTRAVRTLQIYNKQGESKSSRRYKVNKSLITKLSRQRDTIKRTFNTWKKNNRRWLSANNLS